MLAFPEFSVIDTSSKSAEVVPLGLRVPFYNKELLLFIVWLVSACEQEIKSF